MLLKKVRYVYSLCFPLDKWDDCFTHVPLIPSLSYGKCTNEVKGLLTCFNYLGRTLSLFGCFIRKYCAWYLCLCKFNNGDIKGEIEMKKILIVILGACLLLDYYISSKLQTCERVKQAEKKVQTKNQKNRIVQGQSVVRT